jgi:hypothetical protein
LWAALQTIEKEQALRRATMFMCQSYRLQWKGSRVNEVQALDWPRYNVTVPDLGVFNVLMPDTVPDLVQRANAEMALLAAAGPLNPNQSQNIISKQVGPLKVVYDPTSPQWTKYTAIDDILRPLIGANSNGMNIKLRRA